MKAPGLQASADVYRDALGIPHVRAQTTPDAFFVQGYVHAQDRLWQMVYDRTRAGGRLSAWVGERSIVLDVFVRRMGLEAAARADYDALDGETRDMLRAYADGVNAYMETGPRPYELDLLDHTPEPWEPWHSCAVLKIRHVLMSFFDMKLWRARLVSVLGHRATVRVGSGHGRTDLLIVPVGAEEEYDAHPDGLQPTALAFGANPDGSNSWAVHGSRTASGLPILAGDPHRTLEAPNVYTQLHMASPEFDAVGLSMPGVPGLFHFAHTGRAAWCITHAMADNQDLFVERFFEDGTYEYRGERLQPERRTETLDVHGRGTLHDEVAVTRNGPVVFDVDGAPVSVRWTSGDRPDTSLRCVLPMMRAQSVGELEEAMRFWVEPCNSVLMADTNGDIAYLHRGRVPKRPRANGWGPVPGWTGEHDWGEDVPFEELPRLRNPEEGVIVTANNRVCGNEYPHYLSLDYGSSNRARRILARLQRLASATTDDMASIHADVTSLTAPVFMKALADAAPSAPGARALAELLVGWDGSMDPTAAAPAAYAALREELAAELLKAEPLSSLEPAAYPDEPYETPAYTRLRGALPRLIQDGDTGILGGRTWPECVSNAAERAYERLAEKLGADPAKWRWEDIHVTVVRHPLGRRFPEAGLNPPSAGVGGDGDCVRVTYAEAPFIVQHSSVGRYVFDLADRENSAWVVPLGASGDPRSAHYKDQQQAWVDVRMYPVRSSWPEIEAGAEAHVRLDPR